MHFHSLSNIPSRFRDTIVEILQQIRVFLHTPHEISLQSTSELSSELGNVKQHYLIFPQAVNHGLNFMVGSQGHLTIEIQNAKQFCAISTQFT
jgi:hypothetical protein